MEEEKFFIHLNVVLPDIPDERDCCVNRLLALLSAEDVLEKVHVSKNKGEGGICVHYNPEKISLTQVESLIRVAGAAISTHYQHQSYQIRGMQSADAAKVIERHLSDLEGVLSVRVSYSAEQLIIEYDGRRISIGKINKEVKGLGYRITPIHYKESLWIRYRELIFSLLAGFLLISGWIIEHYYPRTGLILLLSSFIIGGYFAFRHSIHALKQKHFDIDVLMVAAALGAGSLGAWGEGALLLFLFSLGHALEHFAMDRARHAVKALAKLVPLSAQVLRDESTEEVPVEELKVGDLVIVRPGESIPADGEIMQGASSINQASITGESLPVAKQMGDQVFSGTINGEGALTVRVDKSFNDTLINKIVRMVLEADSQKSPTERFSDNFVKYFVPAIIAVVLLLIIVPFLFGAAWSPTFMRAMAVLVAASPCALAIGTPAAVLSGVACAARHGVLIKGGMHLENLGAIDTIAFDKTGTLTQGKLDVQQIVTFKGSEEDLLSIAASLEKWSEHPLAQAVVRAAKERNIGLNEVKEVVSIVGYGLRGTLKGKPVAIGNLRLFGSVPVQAAETAKELESKGQTLVLVQYGDEFIGAIGLADSMRIEAKETISSLKKLGLGKVVMLTGDNMRVGKVIGEALGVTDVLAELLPEEKVKAIAELEKQGRNIAMVGDGVNDAPAMTRATVGIAMGGAGSDVALEACDIALMKDDLTKLPFSFKLGKAARSIIRQNLWIALSVVALLIVATLTGVAGMGVAVFIHEGSSLIVVFNALRLLTYSEK